MNILYKTFVFQWSIVKEWIIRKTEKQTNKTPKDGELKLRAEQPVAQVQV